MSDTIRDTLIKVGEGLDEAVGQRAQQAVYRTHRQRQRARAIGRSLAAGAVGVAILGAAFVGGAHLFRGSQPSQVVQAPVPPVRTVRFDDGSEVILLDEASTLQPRLVTPEQTVVALVKGSARFNIVPRPERQFRAESGSVAIHVLGTVFTVERRAERSFVSVERGHVRVTWAGGEAHLYAGGTGLFPPHSPPPEATALPAAEVLPPVTESKAEEPAPRPQRLAAAPVSAPPPRQPAAAVADPVDSLLAQADAERRAHRPQDAVAPLRQLVEQFPGDQRAPLAAFTLGRVLLDELSSAEAAAQAFSRARALEPRGPLAEHALAREVEAWVAAHKPALAAAAARAYLQLYPEGSRARSVRHIGGLE